MWESSARMSETKNQVEAAEVLRCSGRSVGDS